MSSGERLLAFSPTGRLGWFGLSVCLMCVAVVATCGASSAYAQGAKGKKNTPEPEKIAGKITEVEMKGKAALLTIEKEGGETMAPLLLTPKMNVSITAPGDATLLQPKVFVSTNSAVESNKELFARKFEIYHGSATPAAGIQRDSVSAEVFHLAGQIVAAEKDALMINVGGSQKKLNFEQGGEIEVRVHTNQFDLIRAGATVELEGTTRGGKFLPSLVAIQLENPLTADEIAGKRERKARESVKATAKNTSKTKKGTKTAKPDEEMEAKPAEGDVEDPFGFNKKKSGKKPDGKAEEKTP